jgi:hypothetical protein
MEEVIVTLIHKLTEDEFICSDHDYVEEVELDEYQVTEPRASSLAQASFDSDYCREMIAARKYDPDWSNWAYVVRAP